MSNQDDFWTTIATGHTNTVLAGALDNHLSPTDPALSVRHLTDKLRSENALRLPVKSGTRVSFAGGLGAHLTYESVPKDGAFGEVVTVKSANGHITEHDGKVFVQWDDGKFRAIHAQHLRLAKRGKKASRPPVPGQEFTVSSHYTDIAGMGQYNSEMVLSFVVNPDGSATLQTYQGPSKSPKDVLPAKSVKRLFQRGSGSGLNVNTHLSDPRIKKGSALKQQFEKIKALAEKKPDNEFLMSLLKQMADEGFAPTEKQMKVVKEIQKEVEDMSSMQKELKSLEKKASFRVANLGDLTHFLKRADGMLVHKSTNDLWSYSKDAEGNFLVSRLFDDSGEPLKG